MGTERKFQARTDLSFIKKNKLAPVTYPVILHLQTICTRGRNFQQ